MSPLLESPFSAPHCLQKETQILPCDGSTQSALPLPASFPPRVPLTVAPEKIPRIPKRKLADSGSVPTQLPCVAFPPSLSAQILFIFQNQAKPCLLWEALPDCPSGWQGKFSLCSCISPAVPFLAIYQACSFPCPFPIRQETLGGWDFCPIQCWNLSSSGGVDYVGQAPKPGFHGPGIPFFSPSPPSTSGATHRNSCKSS